MELPHGPASNLIRLFRRFTPRAIEFCPANAPQAGFNRQALTSVYQKINLNNFQGLKLYDLSLIPIVNFLKIMDEKGKKQCLQTLSG